MGVACHACPQLWSNKATLCLFASALTPFTGVLFTVYLVTHALVTFLLLVILLFRMSLSTVHKRLRYVSEKKIRVLNELRSGTRDRAVGREGNVSVSTVI